MGSWADNLLTGWNQQLSKKDDNNQEAKNRKIWCLPKFGKARYVGSTEDVLENIRLSIQKSFDHSVDKILNNLVDKLIKPVMPAIQDMPVQQAVKILSYSLVTNSAKRYKKPNQKTSYMPSKNTEIIENCPVGRYRSVSHSMDDLQPSKRNNFIVPSPKRPQQIFWDISRISPATKFVLEAEANQLFGLVRKRLVSLHPHLIHYVLDAKDCQWLGEKGLLPESCKNKRISLVLYDQIWDLLRSEEKYRTFLVDSNLELLNIFTLPNDILKKIRHHIIHLQIKTNGAIAIVPPSKSTANKKLTQVKKQKWEAKDNDGDMKRTADKHVPMKDLLEQTESLKSQLYILDAFSNGSKYSLYNFKYPSIHHIHKSKQIDHLIS